MTTVPFPLKPGQAPVEFRFTVPNVRQLELEAGVGIDLLRLRGQSVHALCLLVCYGLKWSDKTMTVDKAAGLIQTYIGDGGSIKDLSNVVVKALNESGVYGKPTEDAGDEPDPTTTTETVTVN